MENQLLLMEDVRKLGRKGDIVKTKPGYARNYLLPQKKAVVATKQTLRMRERLQEERSQQAIKDRSESEEIVRLIEGKTLSTIVKVDPAGHMYGSVAAHDVAELFLQDGVTLDKQFIMLTHPIKKTGLHKIDIRLKEGVPTFIYLKIMGEGIQQQGKSNIVAEEEPQVEDSQDFEQQ